jgi:hypothetical protein
VALQFAAPAEGERAGLIVFGTDYAWVGVRNTRDGSRLVAVMARGAIDGAPEQDAASIPLERDVVYLRATVGTGAVVQFGYSYDNLAFSAIGPPFTARPGRWVGAKIGLFAAGLPGNSHGAALFDWFRVAGMD